MLDKAEADLRQRGVFIANKPRHCNIDIAVLSEVGFSDSGSISYEAGYTIYATKTVGISIAIRKSVVCGLEEKLNDRLMSRVGSNQARPKVLGRFNSDNFNTSNTHFQHQQAQRNSRMHHKSTDWHLIDYIIMRYCDIKDFRKIRMMSGVNCSTNHMIMSR